MAKHIGQQSIKFEKKISVAATASTVGTKEGEGPLSKYFDVILKDAVDGESSWEKAESKIVKDNLTLAVKKAGLTMNDIDYIFSGDLLNQGTGSAYGIRDLNRPFFGLYGACSTFGESMSLGSVIIESGGASKVLVGASSHFCAAEKQFRFPLGLGTQRPLTSTWTVTGDGAAVLSENGNPPYITGITTGKIVDFGITDANNMGAAMATAAADIILTNLKDFKITPDYYDLIITGDLGYVGKELTIELLKKEGIDISNNYTDCGIEIYDRESQDTHSGGSGCACSAVTFSAYFYNKLKKGELNRILFVPTGALMSSTSVQQGESIPGIAHAVIIENIPKGEL